MLNSCLRQNRTAGYHYVIKEVFLAQSATRFSEIRLQSSELTQVGTHLANSFRHLAVPAISRGLSHGNRNLQQESECQQDKPKYRANNTSAYSSGGHFPQRSEPMLVTILVILLILMLLGGGYGYRSGNNALAGGGGLLGTILIILLILYLLGYVSF
jgi:hypothetical protein